MNSIFKGDRYIGDLNCFIDDLDHIYLNHKKDYEYNATNKCLAKYSWENLDNSCRLYEENTNIELENRYYNNFIRSSSYYEGKNPKINLGILDIVGIDRFKLYIDVEAIDFTKFKGKIDTCITEGGNKKSIIDIRTGEVIPISNFYYSEYIKSHSPDIMKYGIKLRKSKFLLDITAPVALYSDCNLKNVKMQKIVKLLDNIKRELKQNGLYISYRSSRLVYMEINKNVLGKEMLREKLEIFKLLESQIFKGKASINIKDRNSLTFDIINSKNISTLYDKSIELENKYNIYVGSNIYRFEIKLNSSESIHRAFGTNHINLLSKSISLENLFNKYMQKYFIKAIKDGLEQQLWELTELITTSNLKSVRVAYNKGRDKIFDISIFALAMFRKYKELGNSTNFSKDFKKLLLSNEYSFNVNKLKQLEELLTIIKGEEVTLLTVPQNIAKTLAKFS